MKDTFFHLSEEKRQKIIESCIEEFGSNGYERGSTDRIVLKSGISKGGLYEYIHSKKELFLFIVDHTYQLLYDYIQNKIRLLSLTLPDDILERFEIVSSIAIDFYLSRTDVIRLISQTNRIQDPEISAEVEKIFLNRFLPVFGEGADDLAFERIKILELLEWLLLKTRNDFLDEIGKGNITEVRKRYIENWNFYLSVLRNGIYKKGRQ